VTGERINFIEYEHKSVKMSVNNFVETDVLCIGGDTFSGNIPYDSGFLGGLMPQFPNSAVQRVRLHRFEIDRNKIEADIFLSSAFFDFLSDRFYCERFSSATWSVE